jgi:catechol 2,3-dioxygenase-like lactoylglutathione lyase family enzyme
LIRQFEGFDHIDCRVRSLAAVESFYDALMPELGLPHKRFAFVDGDGEWHEISSEHGYNAVEYYERAQPGRTPFFFGLIERAGHDPGFTRIAFRIDRARMLELEGLLEPMGALKVERSEDLDAYPAVFFEDPQGTKLELVARRPAVA